MLKDVTYRDIFFGSLVVFGLFLYFTYGYLWNSAETQARSIKACHSVGADWRYNDNGKVLCAKIKKECD